MDYYNKALKTLETNSDSINAALVKLKIAKTYYYADLTPPENLYLSAYEVLKGSSKKNHQALAYFISGFLEKDSKKKKYFNQKAIEIQKEALKDSPDDVKAKETLALLYNSNSQLEEAISLASEIGNNLQLMLYLNNYGYQKALENKYDEAFNIFQRSLSICKRERNKTIMRNIYENIGRIYRLKGNWEKAYQYQLLTHFFEESLFSEKFSLLVSELGIKYDLQRKGLENKLLAENISTQKKLNILLFLSTITISIVLLLVFLSKRKLKHANTLLDKQNNEILSKQNELESLNRSLHESERNLKEAQSTAKLANWELDLLNNRISFSDQFSNIFGLTNQNLHSVLFNEIEELIKPEDRLNVRNFILANTSKVNVPVNDIEFGIVINESVKWIKAHRIVLLDEQNEIIRLYGTLQDITDAKEKEKIKIEMASRESFARQLIHSQEIDRKRIAGELHDGLGQEILLIKNRALLGLQNSNIDDYSIVQLNEINETVSNVLNMVREISFNLRPAHLERLGLTETISSAVKKLNEISHIEITYNIDNIDSLLTNENEINLFRILQEALNNIIKHSNAKNASVEIEKNNSSITITIKDDGKGFDYESSLKNSSGFGLKNIYNRLHILKGEIQIKSGYLEGTTLLITIPLHFDE